MGGGRGWGASSKSPDHELKGGGERDGKGREEMGRKGGEGDGKEREEREIGKKGRREKYERK